MPSLGMPQKYVKQTSPWSIIMPKRLRFILASTSLMCAARESELLGGP